MDVASHDVPRRNLTPTGGLPQGSYIGVSRLYLHTRPIKERYGLIAGDSIKDLSGEPVQAANDVRYIERSLADGLSYADSKSLFGRAVQFDITEIMTGAGVFKTVVTNVRPLGN